MARRGLPECFNTTMPSEADAKLKITSSHRPRLQSTDADVDAKAAKEHTSHRPGSFEDGSTRVQMMPLTQDKPMDCNFSNNNDNNYLHKKFKKMASTMSVPIPEGSQNGLAERAASLEKNVADVVYNTSISNGSIAASHPEIEKIKEKQHYQNYEVSLAVERKNVQTTFNDNKIRLSDINTFDQMPGKTSFSDEFSNKTETLDSDFIKDVQNGTGGRYVCPYCKLSCAKPSVLQKHIRAHTNERPYPCVPCGFAFKTKSNLYKHRKSRTHALRLQGADVNCANEEDVSGGSESDTSQPPTSVSDAGSEGSVPRPDLAALAPLAPPPNDSSSPEINTDRITPPTNFNISSDSANLKAIYKPKFRAAFYREIDDKDKNKKTFSPNADFLNEHISKIISDNEAIVDVIETPLQKKYSRIKQIAESKQIQTNENVESKSELSPLNLTKNVKDSETSFRKRAHSETFTNFDFNKHPLNPEGSIIKDLLLKTKANGLTPVTNEIEGVGPLYICPLCQIPYRSADNLEIHRMYYCKGAAVNSASTLKDVKIARPENVFMRSNSINVRLPETQPNNGQKNIPVTSPSPRNNKPDNIYIVKQECNDVIAPLPSPGPLLGNTRLVDTRVPTDNLRKSESLKSRPMLSPKRRIEMRSDSYSPRLTENVSPRSTDSYVHPKLRCIDPNTIPLRSMDDTRPNSTSLQMFGGEVKIVDHSGSTTTLRIEPSKNQLSPILIHQNLSPSKLANDNEASNIVVRSGLHSGGTIVHTPKAQTPRITALNLKNCTLPIHDMSHFQFPPLSAITAFNPLTLPPLSPSSTPNGATSILHGGKLIPHVPGMPGPNTPSLYVGTPNLPNKNDLKANEKETMIESNRGGLLSIVPQSTKTTSNNTKIYESIKSVRSPNITSKMEIDRPSSIDITHVDKKVVNPVLPLIRVKNVDEIPTLMGKNVPQNSKFRTENLPLKRNSEGIPKTPLLKEPFMHSQKMQPIILKSDNKSENEMCNFNFESLITKAEIFNNQIPFSEVQKNTITQESSVGQNERSETLYFQKNSNVKSGADERKPKFLRPSTLPLKPGTFTPKRHHGITPNANTMPLVSPETPRPAKAYGQLHLNGNAYTYLGLKCSTKVFYCTINRPQPTYVPNQHFLSMYSNWQLLSELTPDPLGLSASSAMSLYDSRHRPQSVVVAKIKQDLILTHSSQSNKYAKDNKQTISSIEGKKSEDNRVQLSDGTIGPKKELAGGFESNEEYTYIRGRGRGRYVCSECGIRCKKPSMLKKHIRTHTDVRPYTCTHCAFSFKTKGNLTKHMKSKAHYKKCCELGINPSEGTDLESGDVQCSGETDDESDSDGDEGNEGETESSDTEVGKSRLPEHEAAHCLLSLCGGGSGAGVAGGGGARGGQPGLITSARPCTYPYTPAGAEVALESPPSPAADGPPDLERRDRDEPMDLSRADVKPCLAPPAPPAPAEIPTAGEPRVLACLASNTAKLPHHQAHWSNGEPMLHAYLTERALLDSKIKQSQFTTNLSKLRKIELDKTMFSDSKTTITMSKSSSTQSVESVVAMPTPIVKVEAPKISFISDILTPTTVSKEDANKTIAVSSNEAPVHAYSSIEIRKTRNEANAENAKFVVSEYLKMAKFNCSPESASQAEPGDSGIGSANDSQNPERETEAHKVTVLDGGDAVARNVVIGAGGIAFKVTKGKDSENRGSYSPGRLMEDGRRVCDFCNKTFTKPSQLRLHLNIHYMERPFRCSACAVSFRTRGHLQKHERSGSHHNKVSMTSTFGAATSLNPRPFRCSDCNIAFRIHGHLAKHLRSKMHVMRLECLFKLPFGTFTEIERAGVSLTDIDTTDCASSLASLQALARRLHEQDPSRLEYRDPSAAASASAAAAAAAAAAATATDDDDEDGALLVDTAFDSDRDCDTRTNDNCETHNQDTRIIFSATDI